MSVIGVPGAEPCQSRDLRAGLLGDFLQSYPSDLATVIEREKLAVGLPVRKADE